jgi:Zn finger protein HypA/HybF involved in hydrogenase expression
MKNNSTLKFTCPGCKETFEFDYVGEYEFVLCPICGAGHMTVKKGQTITLAAFRFSPETVKIQPTIIA